eukprot:3020667-Prorocentrum_lima.AAC.1
MNERLVKASDNTFTPTLPFTKTNAPYAPPIPEGWAGSESSWAPAVRGPCHPEGSVHRAHDGRKE